MITPLIINAGLQSLGKCEPDRRLRDEDPFEARKSITIKQHTGFGGARVYEFWLAYSALRHLMHEAALQELSILARFRLKRVFKLSNAN